MKIKKFLIQIYEWLYEKRRLFMLRSKYHLKVMNAKKTIKYIKKNNCSIARYGDGEFDLIMKTRDLLFQEQSNDIADRLSAVFDSQNKKLLICIPSCFFSVKDCNEHAREFWIEWGKRNNHQQKIVEMIYSHDKKNYVFGDTEMTRPYIDWKTSKRAEKTFPMIKSIWKNRDIIIVEGTQTRLGVGNDLFNEAKSIKRILAPAVGAFKKYELIKQTVLEKHSDELILLALGPTATILASDLCDNNIQALDIGHIDIEYEWFLRRAKDRVAIEGKFTNEANDGRVFTDCNDPKYLSQIIAEIK